MRQAARCWGGRGTASTLCILQAVLRGKGSGPWQAAQLRGLRAPGPSLQWPTSEAYRETPCPGLPRAAAGRGGGPGSSLMAPASQAGKLLAEGVGAPPSLHVTSTQDKARQAPPHPRGPFPRPPPITGIGRASVTSQLSTTCGPCSRLGPAPGGPGASLSRGPAFLLASPERASCWPFRSLEYSSTLAGALEADLDLWGPPLDRCVVQATCCPLSSLPRSGPSW